MVAIRLDALEVADMPQDIFMSVRVGETQKLSKLSSSRIYNFPQKEGGRFGKLEVFRRIGACTVDVDPVNNTPRNVNIGCGEDSLGALGFSVIVEPKSGSETKTEEPKKDGANIKAAKEYLQQHGLERQLAEAMQAVLRERPDAPAEFLANYLLRAAGKQPAAPPSKPKIGGEVVKAAVPPPSTVAPAFGTMPFRLLPSCGTWIGQLPKTLQSSTTSSIQETPFHLKASVGGMKRIPKRMRQLPAPEAPHPPAPFPVKPSVGTWLNGLPPRLKKLPQKLPQKQQFQLKPSVGTWLAVKIPPVIKEQEPAKVDAVVMNTQSRVGPAFASLGLPNTVFLF